MKYKRNIKLDYLHTLVRNINFTQGFWLLFLLVVKDFSLFEVGLLEMVFHITSLSMEVPTGVIADVFGRKISRLLGIFSYFIYIFIMLFSGNFTVILIGFIFCGLSFTFESGSGEALVYDSLKLMGEEDKFMKVNGMKEVIYQFAGAISLVVSGYVISVSFNLAWYLTLGFYILAMIVILLMRETPLLEKAKNLNLKQLLYNQYVVSTKIVFKNKRLLYLTIIGAMVAAPITTLYLYLPDHLNSLGYSYLQMGLLLGAHSAFAAVGGYYAHRLEKKYKEKKILYFVPLFMVISFWLVLVDGAIIIPFILLGFFDSIFYVVLGDYINRIVPSEIRATALSYGGLMFSLVMVIIFPLIGLIAQISNLWTAYLILAVIISVFYLFLLKVLSGNSLDKT
jgi:MFS family permease